jgi:DNA invertase Pin-like site-specific DNA recombinase
VDRPCGALRSYGASRAVQDARSNRYARVSTDGQTLASQDAQLHAAGCAKVYGEKVSGTKTDRAELARLLKRLETGDVLMVTRLDRLARSTRDLLNILYTLGERGVGFKSLADSWADTTTPHGRLLVTMLAGIAEFERELIRARTGEGRTRAKPRGVRFGRPPVLFRPSAPRSYPAACGGRYAG